MDLMSHGERLHDNLPQIANSMQGLPRNTLYLPTICQVTQKIKKILEHVMYMLSRPN